MKKFILPFISLVLTTGSMAQTSDSLIAVDRVPTQFTTGHLLSNTKTFVAKDTPSFLGIASPCHTYDILLEDMFVKINKSIVRIDARTGKVLDTLATNLHLHFVESDMGTNNLIGLGGDISGAVVYAINTLSKTVTVLNTLPSLTFIYGSATINPLQSLIYVKSNLGIACIDAKTGNLLDTISDPRGLHAIEFDPGTKRIYGFYKQDQQSILCSLDPLTKTYTDIAIQGDIGWVRPTGTLDISGSRFIIMTNLGLTFIRLHDGTISDTINLNNFQALEYINKVSDLAGPSSIQENPLTLTVTAYPNPTRDIIQINGIEPGNEYRVFNIGGQLVLEGLLTSEGINLIGLSAGLYQLRLSNGSSVKIIRQY